METVKFFLNDKAALAAVLLGFSVVTTSVPAFADTTITIAGSTALLPLVKDAANAYQAAHPDVKISVSGGGSGSGIAQVAGKAVQIGDSDITAPGHPELHDNRVAVVGFAVIVHPGAGVKNLSKKQLQDIFSGKISNWKDVGGADQKLVVVNRPRSSGTRAVFAKTVMAGVPINESSLTEDATGTVVGVVKQTPGAISYAAFSGTRGAGVTEVAVDGVEPTDDNIIHGRYAIWSYEHMFTLGPPTGEVSRFIAFVQSNSELVKRDGFILIRDMRVTESDR
jgi:phosphate transport system substrate-binding protein